MTDTTLHTLTGVGSTSARFLTPTPVPVVYKGVVVPDHVRRLWDESLGRIWRRTVDATREAVAAELEQMDGTNLGMSLTRSQAVNVARRGIRPEDCRNLP